MAIVVGEATCEGCGAVIGATVARFVALAEGGEALQFCARPCYGEWLDRPARSEPAPRARARGGGRRDPGR